MKKQPDFEQMYFDFVDTYSSEATTHLNTIVELNWANIQRDELQERVEYYEKLVAHLKQQNSQQQSTAPEQSAASTVQPEPEATWQSTVLAANETVKESLGWTCGVLLVVLSAALLRRRHVIRKLNDTDPNWRKRTTTFLRIWARS